MKTCTCCKRELHLACFGTSSKTSDGIAKRCKECNRVAFHEQKQRELKRAREAIFNCKMVAMIKPNRSNVFDLPPLVIER